jgi:hypothetical protein
LLQYKLAILSFITVIGMSVAYDFNSSFAFHTPGSGYTIMNGKMYANNGTDSSLSLLFVKPANGTITLANPAVPQPMDESSMGEETPMSEESTRDSAPQSQRTHR